MEKKFPNPQLQGFQKRLSCITVGFNLQETTCHGSSVCIAFLDCKKKYDTVRRKGLMVKFQKLGLKGKIWEIIDDCHVGNESTVAGKWYHLQMV